jgi:hypothetical protein
MRKEIRMAKLIKRQESMERTIHRQRGEIERLSKKVENLLSEVFVLRKLLEPSYHLDLSERMEEPMKTFIPRVQDAATYR